MASGPRPLARAAGAVALALGMLSLAACAPEPGPPAASTRPSPTSSGSPAASGSPTPSASAAAVPTDCRAMLSEAVLAQLGEIPLNPEGYGPAGVQPDGSLVCLWRDPRADTTFLSTEISRMNRGPALDMLNALADTEGFTCYTPSGGTRCEKTWTNEQYPVTDGRTLFWRDDILVDTQFSNLAPSGYTDSIVRAIFGS